MAFDSDSIIKKLQEVHEFFENRKRRAKDYNIRNIELYLELCDIADKGLQRIIAVSMDWGYEYDKLDVENCHLVESIFYQYKRKPYGEYFKNEYCKSLAKCLVNIELYSLFRSRLHEFREDEFMRMATTSYFDSRGLFKDYKGEKVIEY